MFRRTLSAYHTFLQKHPLATDVLTSGTLFFLGDVICQHLEGALAKRNNNVNDSLMQQHENVNDHSRHHENVNDHSHHHHQHVNDSQLQLQQHRNDSLDHHHHQHSGENKNIITSNNNNNSSHHHRGDENNVAAATRDSSGRQVNKWLKNFDLERSLRMALYGALVFGPGSHFWYKMLDKRIVFAATAATSHGRARVKQVAAKVVLDEGLFGPLGIVALFASVSAMEGRSLPEIRAKIEKDFLTTFLTEMAVWVPAGIINFTFVPNQFRVTYVNLVCLVWNIFLSRMQNYDLATQGEIHEKIHRKLHHDSQLHEQKI